jgi:hypothetical protein
MIRKKIHKKLYYLYQKFLMGSLSDKEKSEFEAMKRFLNITDEALTEEYSNMAIEKLSTWQIMKLSWYLCFC